MASDELLAKVLLGLPERLEKIERALFEQRLLISVLLARSGLDAQGIERAFALAEQSWEKFVDDVGTKKMMEWAKTPEGQEARRKADEAFRRRTKEVWREDCLEEKRILPDPTAMTDSD